MKSSVFSLETPFNTINKFLLYAGIYSLNAVSSRFETNRLSKTNTILYYISAIFTWLFALILILGMVIQMIVDRDDALEAVQTLYICLTQLAYFLKLINYMINRNCTVELTEQYLRDIPRDETTPYGNLMKNLSPEQEELVKSTLSAVNIKIIGYRISCVGVILSYLVVPLISGKPPLPGYYPGLEPDNAFYCIYVFQVVAIASGAFNNSSLDSLAIMYISMGSVQIQVLIENLRKIGSKVMEGEDVEESLRKCVYHHTAILRFVEIVERQFSYGILFQFFASVGVICITGFLFLVVPSSSPQFFTLVIYFCCMSAQVVMYCWFGHELIYQSMQINDACYMSTWYEHNAKYRKSIFILMERSKKPVAIRAGNMFPLSLGTLLSILKSSYSYFAVLQRIYKE